MKQRIEAVIKTPHTGYRFNIDSVYEVDGQLIAISSIKFKGGFVTDSMAPMRAARVVNTSANQELPVVHYLTGVSEEDVDRFNVDGKFILINDISDISELLAKGKNLFEPRSDGLKAVRLAQFERAFGKPQPTLLPQVENAKPAQLPDGKLESVLNIYPVIDDGVFKIVVENIRDTLSQSHVKHLNSLIDDARRQVSLQFDLVEDCFMAQDETALIDGTIEAGQYVRYRSDAVEFVMPTRDADAALNLLFYLEAMVREARKSDNKYYQPYQHVQVGKASVLSCFDDLLLAKDQCHYDDVMKVLGAERLNLREFLQQPGHIHQPESVIPVLMDAFLKADIHGYEPVKAMMQKLIELGGVSAVWDPQLALQKILDMDLSVLQGDATLEQKLAVVEKMEAALIKPENFTLAATLLKPVGYHAVNNLVKKVLGLQSYEGGKYSTGYTEIQLLLNAEYNLHADGKIGFRVANNAAYQEWYAKGCNNHAILEAEMRHLAKAMDLNFAEGCNFHDEIVFDEVSSLKLKAVGAHLNEAYLRPQVKLQPQTKMHIATTAAPEAKPETLDDLMQSKAVTDLVKKYPQSREILQVMRDSGLFTNSPIENRHLIAEVMLACESFRIVTRDLKEREDATHEVVVSGRKRPEREYESIEALVNLYKMLAPKAGVEPVLTMPVHREIIGYVLHSKCLGQVAEYLRLLGEMSKSDVQDFILQSHYYLSIKEMTAAFDASDESFLYFYRKDPKHVYASALCDALSCEELDGKLDWLRKEDFRTIVDNFETGKSRSILKVLSYLHRAGALESHRDRGIQHPEIKNMLHELLTNQMLNKDNVEHAFHNPDFTVAMHICENANLLGWRMKKYSKENDAALRQGLLERPELTKAIREAVAVLEWYQEQKNGQLTIKVLTQVVNDLIGYTNFKMPVEEEKPGEVMQFFNQALAFFQPDKPASMAEYLQHLKKKYGYQEAVQAEQLQTAPSLK